MAKPDAKINVLFVCSRNQWRSPTAEQLFRRHPHVNARSGGTSPKAKHPVNEQDLAWADVVMVMEQKHKSRLMADFSDALRYKPLHVLDIPDEYAYMDAELVEMLEQSVTGLLGLE